ncbi:60S ribosome subunit biogenesis protein NOP53 [Ceratocystis lukuohia]|uniref:Ribosome biogenesis protein NOP53 n=1 Tax=Ceratocystis lukuohia TaxID=2019550 RepID=A0ABR4MBK6_9PEZI
MPVIQGLSAAPSAPAQHKQSSRKGKKAWRKNIDVTEVEQGLEERNDQIIQGGILAEKESEDLFDIDTKGDVASKKSIPTRLRGLKADEIINQRSAVPSVSLRKRPAANSKVGDGLVETKRLRKDWVSHKELSRLRRVADGEREFLEVKDASYDLWDAEPVTTSNDDEFNFIPKASKAKLPSTMKEQPVSLAANGKAIPAVKKPTGGFSYNPTFDDYTNRLDTEGAKAMEAEKKRLEQIEIDRQRAEAAARSAAEAEAAEAKLDLSEWEEDSAWEGFESGAEDAAAAKASAKRPQRKTQAQRNRIKARKEEEQAANHERAMKRKQEQLRQLKRITKEVEAQEQEKLAVEAEVGSSSESEGDDSVLRRKAVSRLPLLEKELEIVLPDELQDSLRALKPEGNLLKDRYRNLLVRGRVDARKRVPFKKQRKGKLTEKWTYKDFKI